MTHGRVTDGISQACVKVKWERCWTGWYTVHVRTHRYDNYLVTSSSFTPIACIGSMNINTYCPVYIYTIFVIQGTVVMTEKEWMECSRLHDGWHVLPPELHSMNVPLHRRKNPCHAHFDLVFLTEMFRVLMKWNKLYITKACLTCRTSRHTWPSWVVHIDLPVYVNPIVAQSTTASRRWHLSHQPKLRRLGQVLRHAPSTTLSSLQRNV